MADTNKEFSSAVHQMYLKEKTIPDQVFLRQPIDGQWHLYTWQKTMNMARRLVTFFKEQGLQKGDRVSILSKNCAEWYITDFAIMMAGLINVPLYATQHHKIINYILTEANVKLIFIGKLDEWSKQEQGIPDNIKRVIFPYDLSIKADHRWVDIMKNNEPDPENHTPEPEDTFSIIYTSGTTGDPKGVVMTYNNQQAAIQTFSAIINEGFNAAQHNTFVSYLPLAHIVERLIEISSTHIDLEVSFVESLDTFAANLQEVSPTLFFAVPRIWNVFKQKILEKLPQKKLNILLKIPLLSSLIKRKVQHALGLSNAICISGAAPLPLSTLNWFDKLGITIYEGYGSTENFASTSLNTPSHRKPGTVGKPVPGFEYKLSDSKEILTKSAMVMKEYYLKPEKTKEVIDEDMFYHTGDTGEIDDNGFVTITGRTKDKFKTNKGEYVVPAPIEAKFAHVEEIEQLCLVGAGLRQPKLLINLSEKAKKHSPERVSKKLQRVLDKINNRLTKFESISHIVITKDDWSVDNELLTPTFKVKRFTVEAKYKDLTSQLRDVEQNIIWEDKL